MKWTDKLVAEVGDGEALEREIVTIEREYQVSPASIGLKIAEGKSIMEGLQRELVTAQMERLEPPSNLVRNPFGVTPSSS